MKIFLLNYIAIIAIIIVNLKDINALSEEARQTVVYWHNKLRSDLMHGIAKNKSGNIPKPKNMKQMYYSLELERNAQEWADKCQYYHSGTWYGESFYSWPQYLNESDAMKSSIIGWWTEAEARGVIGPYSGQTCFPYDGAQHGRQIGHWSQIAWWETDKVGCGIGRCNPYKSNVFCHYNPPGNIYGGCVFWVGEPCVECKNNCNRTSLLCYDPKYEKSATGTTTKQITSTITKNRSETTKIKDKKTTVVPSTKK